MATRKRTTTRRTKTAKRAPTKRASAKRGAPAATRSRPATKSTTKSTRARRSSRGGAAPKRGTAKRGTAKRSSTERAAPKRASAAGPKSAAASANGVSANGATGKRSGTKGDARKLERYRAKRDFTKTAEPSGGERRAAPARRRSALRFVIQKHAASHLHYDLRLELDGVMKSWAVPKGPSVVPGVRRLAMEVEDHPISYNTFEGTIPEGEYGGGTVMIWDRGTYGETNGGGVEALREGYERGKLDISFDGERLQGAFALVRTRGDGERAQWLLIKRTDAHARRDRELTDAATTSVVTGRSMDQIARGKRVWHSNR